MRGEKEEMVDCSSNIFVCVCACVGFEDGVCEGWGVRLKGLFWGLERVCVLGCPYGWCDGF